MYPPEVRDFVWIADNAYTREQIISMEGLLLKTLDYNLGCPLPLHFLRRFSKATAADTVTHHLSKYVSPPTLNPSTPHHISRTHPLRITPSLPVCRRFACAMHTCVPKQPCHPRPIFAQDE
jgi:hypothetical protein